MRLAALALAILGVAAAFSAVNAQTRPGFELGPELNYYTYRESALNITGGMAGLEGSWTWRSPWSVFVRLEATGDVALVDYSSSVSGKTNGIWDLKGETRALVGGDVTLRPGLVLTPYSGLGYRALYDMEGGTHTNRNPPQLGYNRLSQYLYLPLGATLGIAYGGWTVKPNFEADYLILGWQTSYLRAVGFDADVANLQHNGYGFRGRVMFATDSAWGPIEFGPYATYWKIGQSVFSSTVSAGKIGTAFEPSNHTVEAGLAFLFSF
jgi:hypothetical protein